MNFRRWTTSDDFKKDFHGDMDEKLAFPNYACTNPLDAIKSGMLINFPAKSWVSDELREWGVDCRAEP